MSKVINGKRFGHKCLAAIAIETNRDLDGLKSLPYHGRD